MGKTAMDVIDKKRSLAQGLKHYGTHALQNTGNTLVEQQLRQNLSLLNAPQSPIGENGGRTSHSQCGANGNRHLKRKKMSKKQYNREVHKPFKEFYL